MPFFSFRLSGIQKCNMYFCSVFPFLFSQMNKKFNNKKKLSKNEVW